jgi:hypothetical protein
MGSLTVVIGTGYFIWGATWLQEITQATSSLPSNMPNPGAIFKQGEPVFSNPHIGIALVWWLVLGVAAALVQHLFTAKKHEHAPAD